MSTVEKDRRGIQSIEVGGTLLQALVRNGAPMMLRVPTSAPSMTVAPIPTRTSSPIVQAWSRQRCPQVT